MKVDVSIVKKPAVKVDITLARGSRRGHRVNIPVRVAPYLAVDAEDTSAEIIEAAELCSSPEEEYIEAEEYIEETLCDEDVMGEEEPYEDIPAEAEPDVTAEDVLSEPDPDEEELLRLIAREEDEMESARLKSLEAEAFAHDAFDADENFSFADAAEVEDEDAVESDRDEDTGKPLISIGDIIDQTLEAKADAADATAKSAESQPDSISMSYIDRSESGDVFEVDNVKASGQKVVCVDGESGRISRVCGFIRNNSSAVAPSAPENSAGQDGE